MAGPGRARSAARRTALVCLPDAPGLAFVTWAAVAKQAEGVVARVVTIAPLGGDRVLADEMDVDERCLFGGQGRPGVEPARKPRLAAAERARAEPAERGEVVGRCMPVGPLDREASAGAVGVDPGWNGRGSGGGHGPIVWAAPVRFGGLQGVGYPRSAVC